MKFFKYLALIALASVPLLMIERRSQSVPVRSAVDDDDIFEQDLRVE